MSSVLLVLLVAAAANTRPAIEAMRPALERVAGERVDVRYGATGTLARQIENGAPFDLFLSADEETPAQLLAAGLLEKPTPCYAVGTLVLVRARDAGFAVPARLDVDSGKSFSLLPFRHLAVASSKTAPYGRAARDVMTRLGIKASVSERVVVAENVELALSFVRSGNAELGFVSASSVMGSELTAVPIDESLYRPIRQYAGVVAASNRSGAARRVLTYLLSPEARTAWKRFGYRSP
ncbi:MAG: molybdate ABC transporter substrate-binding protein [Thermoanaerobaculia bacterium]